MIFSFSTLFDPLTVLQVQFVQSFRGGATSIVPIPPSPPPSDLNYLRRYLGDSDTLIPKGVSDPLSTVVTTQDITYLRRYLGDN